MVAAARACTHWQLTSTPRHKDTAMNHSRRITVMLAGLAATVATFSAATPSARAVPVPPSPTDAPPAAARGQHQQCPSAVAAQLGVGKAWEHRRKFGGVGPAVGGRCPLNKNAHHMARRI
jgi:hypothetical protein